MKLQSKFVLHYATAVVVCVLLSATASIAAGYLFGGFAITLFGSTYVWRGFMPDSVLGILLSFALSFIGTFLFIALFYAKRMSAPIVMLLRWVDQLSQGDYSMPRPTRGPKKSFKSIRLFGELTGNMMQLTDRLQQNERESERLETMRKEWTAGVTHDLKTPLSYIHGYTAMLLSNDHAWTEAERRMFLTIMQEKAMHIEKLIDDLNEAFRLEKGMAPLAVQSMDMIAFLECLVEDMRQQPAAQSFRVQLRMNANRLIYTFDEQLMRRALLNLLMNAVLHNPPGTEITVTVEYSDASEALEITISDNGKGMSEIEQKHLFERYYRGTSTETPTGGTGLGMAVAKELIAMHGGAIHVRSAIQQGTTLTVTLPTPLRQTDV